MRASNDGVCEAVSDDEGVMDALGELEPVMEEAARGAVEKTRRVREGAGRTGRVVRERLALVGVLGVAMAREQDVGVFAQAASKA